MGHSLVGFFAGNLVIDENLEARAAIPGSLDGKIRVRPVSTFAGGSAANAAVTFGALAKLDPSNGGGAAHLYTYSEARTPGMIVDDLEEHNVHLKKLGIVPKLGTNSVVSHEGGKKLLFVRETPPPRDYQRSQNSAFTALEELRRRLDSEGSHPLTQELLEQTEVAIRSAFREAADHLPHPAANVDSQFRSDLAGSNIAMVDMHYPGITLRTAKEARGQNIPVVLDLGRWADHAEALIEHSDIVIASHDFTVPGGPKMTGDQILDYLRDKGIRQAAVTRGHLSTLFYDELNPGGAHRGAVDVPREPKLVSTSGAGDVMHGAACYFLARGHHLGEALWQANRVSSFSVAFPDKRQFFKHMKFDLAGALHFENPFEQPEQALTLEA